MQVSRLLDAISHSRDVWSDAYRRSKFIRPPGPFPSQSAHYLENSLVLGFRVDRNFRHRDSGPTPREMPLHKLKEIRYAGQDLGVSLVFGRFILVAFNEEVRCYDLEMDRVEIDSDARGFFYRPKGATLKSFHCVSSIDVEGRPCACVVLKEVIQTDSPPQGTSRMYVRSDG